MESKKKKYASSLLLLLLAYGLFWICRLAFAWTEDPITPFVFAFIDLLIIGLACWFISAFLAPRYFQKQRYFVFLLFYLSTTVLASMLLQSTQWFWANDWEKFKSSILGVLSNVSFQVFNSYFVVLVSCSTVLALELALKSIKDQQALVQMQHEKAQAELNFLKAQINPHFLFNAVNTVFFQIDKQNTAARETLLKFSNLLRYQLYECDKGPIEIEKELKFLRDYAELQSLRKDKSFHLHYAQSTTVSGFMIEPLVLIPIVENAFKHLSHHLDRRNSVSIVLDYQSPVLSMEVVNTFEKNSSPPLRHSGIGLDNLKKRLKLLYPHKHELNIKEADGRFFVQIKIQP